MRATRFLLFVVASVLILAAGCKKDAIDQLAFKSALNSYYAPQQQCLWTAPVKFPAQADTAKDEDTKPYDALTDAGLLTRKPEEKKRFLIGSKPVNDYDIADQGRSFWTPDPSQPGYGNFCYGHPEVSNIDTSAPTTDDGTRYSVSYHYSVEHPPAWANSAEIKTAFPKLAADTSNQETATATLAKSANGWQVQNVQAAPMPASSM